ncbi:MAG: M67 family metallopeptidase [Candidatus Nezhaarchaeota archaeon]|nr:M67 family metallopeptidase [Candidatus Nezhaarchaeota archaeon]
MGRLRISGYLLREIVHDSLAEGHEVCGFLLGVVNDDDLKVVELYKVKNVSMISRVRFEMDPRDIYEAHKYAERLGLEIIGIYHSHPGPPTPSVIDLEGMKHWPIVWLIVSSIDGSMAAYVVKDGSTRELEVLLE